MHRNESGIAQTARLIIAVGVLCFALLLGVELSPDARSVLHHGNQVWHRLEAAAMAPTLGDPDYTYHSQPRHYREDL